MYLFLKRAPPRCLFQFFCSISNKQYLEYLQQINVKIYLESGTVIRTHNFWSMSLLPLPLDQGSCYKICLFTYLRNSVLQNWLVHLICARFAETKFLHLWPCPSLIQFGLNNVFFFVRVVPQKAIKKFSSIKGLNSVWPNLAIPDQFDDILNVVVFF